MVTPLLSREAVTFHIHGQVPDEDEEPEEAVTPDKSSPADQVVDARGARNMAAVLAAGTAGTALLPGMCPSARLAAGLTIIVFGESELTNKSRKCSHLRPSQHTGAGPHSKPLRLRIEPPHVQ